MGAANEANIEVGHGFGRYLDVFQKPFGTDALEDSALADGGLLNGGIFGRLHLNAAEQGVEFLPAAFQIVPAGHILGQFPLNKDCGAVFREGKECFQGGKGHPAAEGDEDGFIFAAADGESGGGILNLFDLAVGDVVKGEAQIPELSGRVVEGEDSQPFIEVVNGEGIESVVVFHRQVPHVVNGEVEQNIVGGSAGLEDGLAAGDILVESGEVFPENAVGIEVGGGVEEPAGPGFAGRGVGHAVVEDVVDAADEALIDFRFGLGEGDLKMFGEPGAGFGGNQRFAGNMGGGRCEFEHQGIGKFVVEGGILCQAGDGKTAGAVDFRFGDVRGGIDIENVGGCAVGLIAGLEAVFVRPADPLFDILQMEFADGPAVIIADTGGVFGRGVSEKCRQLLPEIISSTLLEFIE